MRKLVVISLLGALAALSPTTFAAGGTRDASDLFLRAYMQIQEGDAATERGDYKNAESRYQDALTILKDIETVQPDWNPHIIGFRKRYCEQHINDVHGKVGGPAATTSSTPAAAASSSAAMSQPPAPAAGASANQLSSEVERLRQQVQRLQSERPATALPSPAPLPPPAVVASSDTEKLRQLETDLADARRQIQQLQNERSGNAPPTLMPSGDSQKINQLTDQLTTLRSQLQQMLAERSQWEQAREELGRLQTERASLLRQLQEKDQKLAAGPAALEPQAAKLAAEQLAQQTRLVESLRGENKSLALKLTGAETAARTSSAKVAELTPVAEQLAAIKAENDKIRQELADKTLLAEKAMNESKKLGTMPAEIAAVKAENQKIRQELADKTMLAEKALNDAQRAGALPAQLSAAKADLEKARQELASKDREIRQAQRTVGEVASLQKSNADLRVQLSKTQALLATIPTKEGPDQTMLLNQIRQQLIEAKAQLAETQKRSADQQRQVSQTLSQLENMRRELADTSKRAETAAADLVAANRQNTQLKRDLDRQTADVRRQQSATGNIEREKTAELEKLKQQLDQLTKTAATRETERTELAKQNAALKEAVDQKTAELRKQTVVPAAAELQKLREQLTEAQRVASTRETERAALAKQNETLRETIEQKTAELRKQQNSTGSVDREKAAELAKLKEQLEQTQKQSAAREAERVALAKQNAQLQQQVEAKSVELRKQQKLAAAPDREKIEALERLKDQLEESRRLLAEREAQRDAVIKQNVTLKESIEQKTGDLRKLQASASTSDRDKAAQTEKLQRQLEEARNLAAAREKARLIVAKENALLQASIAAKTAEYEKLLNSRGGDNKKGADLQKRLQELERKLSVYDALQPKLSTEEQTFLKKTEVIIKDNGDKKVSGEINTNVRQRSKERALAQVSDARTSVPTAPPATLAQAGTASSNTVSDAMPEPSKNSVAALSPELKTLVDQARELFKQKKYDEAAAKYREVLKRDPDNLFGLSNLAAVRFEQDRLEEAEHLLQRALQVAPNDGYSHSVVGIIYYRQKKIDAAIDELTKATKLNPENAEAHNYLGIACWQKGWRSAAEQELRRAIELRPDNADAHYNLAVVYATQKPAFLGLAKFHYRKTLEMGRARDEGLEKILGGDGASK